jgi:hypothetical protein
MRNVEAYIAAWVAGEQRRRRAAEPAPARRPAPAGAGGAARQRPPRGPSAPARRSH